MKYVTADSEITRNVERNGTKVELKLEAGKYEYPQVDSLDELTTFVGGDTETLTWVNSHIAKDAKAVGRAALGAIPENADITVALQKVADAIRNFTPQGGERATTVNKKKAAAYDAVEALLNSGKQVSMEDLQALLASAK